MKEVSVILLLNPVAQLSGCGGGSKMSASSQGRGRRGRKRVHQYQYATAMLYGRVAKWGAGGQEEKCVLPHLSKLSYLSYKKFVHHPNVCLVRVCSRVESSNSRFLKRSECGFGSVLPIRYLHVTHRYPLGEQGKCLRILGVKYPENVSIDSTYLCKTKYIINLQKNRQGQLIYFYEDLLRSYVAKAKLI